MINCDNGDKIWAKRLFFGRKNHKRTQRLFLQRMGGADDRDIGFFLWFTQRQSDSSVGVQCPGFWVFGKTFRDCGHSVLLLADLLAENDKTEVLEPLFYEVDTVVFT